MEKRTKTRKYIAYAILGLLLCGFVYIEENVFPYMGIVPWRMHPAENHWKFPNGYAPENFGVKGQKIAIKTPDGLTLSAWIVPSNTDTTFGTVIQLHGISNCKEANFPRAKVLADSGYASLLLDLRAHGESEGQYCTFGYYEKNDVKAVVDTLEARFPGRPVGIWGASLGGAITLQSLGNDSRFAFGIVESTFDEYPKVVEEYGADYFLGLRPTWIFHRVMEKSGMIAHFDPYSVLPVKSAAQIRCPVLFMHGDKDARIPIEFDKRNYEAVQNPGKKWITVPGAGHNNLWDLNGAKLALEVNHFLSDCRARH